MKTSNFQNAHMESHDAALALPQQFNEAFAADLDQFGSLISVAALLNNELRIYNDNHDFDLAGAFVDWDGFRGVKTIGPGRYLDFENFSFLTLQLVATTDGSTHITMENMIHNVASYNVTRLMSNGRSDPLQFVNPRRGATESYTLRAFERILIVPQNTQVIGNFA